MQFEVIATAPSEQVPDEECSGDQETGVLEKCRAADTSADGAKWIIKQTAQTKTYFMW